MDNIPRDVGKRPVRPLAGAYIAASALALGGLWWAMRAPEDAVQSALPAKGADTATKPSSEKGAAQPAGEQRSAKNADYKDAGNATSQAHTKY
ncbi:hypothetical protein NMY22_g2336 [Coprinellus aureogranulatus]|nr:hypothetical protein NMY22_g2336 [Coprinellus aureogranulatus]